MATWLTSEDVQNYGGELVDFSQRAALHAVAPAIQNLEQANAELRQRLAIEARHRLDQAVERAVPNYRKIDRDPHWHQYLRTVDALSGRVRQTLLDDAIASGAANRVIAFFQGFLREHQGAGQLQGQTRGQRSSSSKPVYTRAQIAQLYEAHRKGAWAGREAEWTRLEADFCRAGAEGRILGPPYLSGK